VPVESIAASGALGGVGGNAGAITINSNSNISLVTITGPVLAAWRRAPAAPPFSSNWDAGWWVAAVSLWRRRRRRWWQGAKQLFAGPLVAGRPSGGRRPSIGGGGGGQCRLLARFASVAADSAAASSVPVAATTNGGAGTGGIRLRTKRRGDLRLRGRRPPSSGGAAATSGARRASVNVNRWLHLFERKQLPLWVYHQQQQTSPASSVYAKGTSGGAVNIHETSCLFLEQPAI